MKKNTQSVSIKSRKKYVIFGVIVLIVLSLGLVGWKVYSDSAPKPLGDKLAYIGKKDFGCYAFCYILPNSDYYYSTDMSTEEIEKYFSKATFGQKREADSFHDYAVLEFEKEESGFSIYYHENSSKLPDGIPSPSSHKHIVRMTDSDYKIAKDSL